jgi:hypothetical protein
MTTDLPIKILCGVVFTLILFLVTVTIRKEKRGKNDRWW